jgi:hypothetical protein
MFELIFAVIGLAIGWALPQPAWIAPLLTAVLNWIKSKFSKE